MHDYLIYGCEIINCIPTREPMDDRYTYCKGWEDFEGMKISVIGAYQSDFDRYGCWIDPGMTRCRDYIYVTKIIIGFNSKNFDDRLMTANGMPIETNYDILEEVRIAAGWEADYRSVPRGFSYRLDDIARANGMAKTGSGALAPMLWQDGKQQEVIDYAINDVKITKAILDLGLAGELIDPNTEKLLQLNPLPEPLPYRVINNAT